MRLQPVTRLLTGEPLPKQYCRIVGDRTLLQGTVDRIEKTFPVERTLVVVTAAHADLARRQLPQLPQENLLVQPANRDTGPGILLSLLNLTKRDPEATVAIFPSDHYVGETRAFLRHVRRLLRLVKAMPHNLALLGMRPESADPDYGYVLTGRPVAIPDLHPAFHVAGFCEKPASLIAKQLIARGGLWNSLVMAFRVTRVLTLLRRVVGTPVDAMRALTHHPEQLEGLYRTLAPWNFSRDFLRHSSSSLVVAPVHDVAWSDWGTPAAISRTLRGLGMEIPWGDAAIANVA